MLSQKTSGKLSPEDEQASDCKVISKKRTSPDDEQEEEKKSEPPIITYEQCNICCEDLKETKAVIDCGHFFCVSCIQKWAGIENTCPYCKAEFTKITEKALFKKQITTESKGSLGKYKRRPTVRNMLLRSRTQNGTGNSSTHQHGISAENSEVVKVIEV